MADSHGQQVDHMAIRSRAPMRIDFGGGWSDVARFCETETGVVVNAAISLYAHGEFLLGGRLIRLHASDIGERLTVSSPRELVYNGRLDLQKAALNMLPVTGGIEIISWCDAPPGSGLGGSGALDVALVAGLARCRQEGYDAIEFAELGFMLEAGELGLLGGKQDQYAGAVGGFLRLDFDVPDQLRCVCGLFPIDTLPWNRLRGLPDDKGSPRQHDYPRRHWRQRETLWANRWLSLLRHKTSLGHKGSPLENPKPFSGRRCLAHLKG